MPLSILDGICVDTQVCTGALNGRSPMSHVDFHKMLYISGHGLFSPMSHFEFKKRLCRMSLYF